MEWIKITKRSKKPFPCVSVLVYEANEQTVNEGFYDGVKWFLVREDYDEPLNINHWMPLPEPPK